MIKKILINLFENALFIYAIPLLFSYIGVTTIWIIVAESIIWGAISCQIKDKKEIRFLIIYSFLGFMKIFVSSVLTFLAVRWRASYFTILFTHIWYLNVLLFAHCVVLFFGEIDYADTR